MKHIGITTVAFDADDTLWVNEPYYQYCEERFTEIINPLVTGKDVRKELVATDIQNVGMYGYGIKGFMLSMIETAIRITDGKVDADVISEIIHLGKKLYAMPIELLDGAEDIIKELKKSYRLVLATKGDLLDQQRKLKQSGLEEYFDHIEVMSEKKEEDYLRLLKNCNEKAENFMMVGNSLKSDIIPVLNIGGYATHVPFHVTWEHEKTDKPEKCERFSEIERIMMLKEILL